MALIEVAGEKLHGKTSEADVFDVLSDICDVGNLLTFKHSPMDLKEGCEVFLQHWEPNLEEFLIKRDTSDANLVQQYKFCGNEIIILKNETSDKSITKACQNIGIKEMPSEDQSVFGDQFRIDMGVSDP